MSARRSTWPTSWSWFRAAASSTPGRSRHEDGTDDRPGDRLCLSTRRRPLDTGQHGHRSRRVRHPRPDEPGGTRPTVPPPAGGPPPPPRPPPPGGGAENKRVPAPPGARAVVFLAGPAPAGVEETDEKKRGRGRPEPRAGLVLPPPPP